MANPLGSQCRIEDSYNAATAVRHYLTIITGNDHDLAAQSARCLIRLQSCGSQNSLKMRIDVILILKSSLLVDLIARIGLIQSCQNF